MQIAAFLCILLTVLLSVGMLVQGIRHRVELLSFRNLFLLGFIIFQLTSLVVTASTGETGGMRVSAPDRAAIEFIWYVVLFLLIFLTVYRSGILADRVASWFRSSADPPALASGLVLAVTFLIFGLFLKRVLGYIPLVGILTGMMGSGLIAVAVGLGAWYWAQRALNPIAALGCFGLLGVALVEQLIQSFSRREKLTLVLAFAWGAFHGAWKWLRPWGMVGRLGVVTAIGLIFLGAFTAIRSGGERDRSLAQNVQLMLSTGATGVKEGIVAMLAGQNTAANSMWIIENYPENFDYDPLHSLRYFLTQPIPRAIWAEKPDALGRIAPRQANFEAVDTNFSIGPGVIGHAVADLPWIALPLYAVLLAMFLRFFDSLVKQNPVNPFIILTIGVANGQIIGLARGELGLFMFQTVTGIFGAAIAMFVALRTLKLFGWVMETASDGQGWSYAAADDWDATGQYADYGDPPLHTDDAA